MTNGGRGELPAYIKDAEDADELEDLDSLEEGGCVEACLVRCVGDQRSENIGKDGDDG